LDAYTNGDKDEAAPLKTKYAFYEKGVPEECRALETLSPKAALRRPEMYHYLQVHGTPANQLEDF
jgi:hypothetical protein